MSKPLAILMLSLGSLTLAATANAGIWDFFNHDHSDCKRKCMASAPEIDPASALGALTLLGGGLLVLRGRSKK